MPSSGWPPSRGATARSGCGASRTAASPRSRSRSCARRTSGRSCRVQATDDRYRDDVHVIGGCVTASELSQYAVSQVAMNAMPPDAVVPRRRLAGRVAGTARGDAAVAVRMAAPAGGRAVLAARLAGARLRRDRCGDPEHRRLVRRLCRRGVPDAGALHRADADAGRQLGPRLAAGLAARAEPRRAPRDPAVLRPVAARRAERHRRGARRRLVRARVRRARGIPRGVARAVAGGRRLSTSGDHGPAPPARGWDDAARGPSRGARSGRAGRRHLPASRHGRHARVPVVGRRRGPERAGARPPAGRGDGPDVHERSPRRAALHPRRAGRDPVPHGRRAGRDGRRAPGRRGAGRDLVLGRVPGS